MTRATKAASNAALAAAAPLEEEGADALRQPASAASRSLALLAELAREGRALPLAELAARLDLPKATTHRLCLHLLDGGYLMREAGERAFEPGPALRRLALDTLNHGTVRGLRHQVLSELVAQVGETCNFTTLDGASVLYLDRVEAPWPWRLSLEVGVHVPLHCTASGKLFLALADARKRQTLLDGLSLQRMTERTLCTRKALLAECRRIAAQDHSVDNEEFIVGSVAAAVPVRDPQGAVRAALAVHAPTARLSVSGTLAHLPALRAAAARMGALI